jgi:YHS domain-containing protein
MAKDPVCGMTVDGKDAAATAIDGGKIYYLCAAARRDTFVKGPKRYAGDSRVS